MAETYLSRHPGHIPLGTLDEMADLYERVYAEPPYDSAPKFSRARFASRTREQALTRDFTLITARRDGVLAGYTFGFPMPPGAWWAAASRPSAAILAAPKFAVIELMVDRPRRREGIGRALLSALLDNRPEPYATLAAVVNADAYGWYLRNGWRKTGEFRVEPPFADALLLDLPR
ncbi:GNAT family N-acetyltransferase [Actinomadura sp. SCN-SB]|uniref:GNAT family N-acetyltransferase n=1 Tax=Actinomadura sp. SCN-SB TaxID=3373092 RepID=UPI0037512235